MDWLPSEIPTSSRSTIADLDDAEALASGSVHASDSDDITLHASQTLSGSIHDVPIFSVNSELSKEQMDILLQSTSSLSNLNTSLDHLPQSIHANSPGDSLPGRSPPDNGDGTEALPGSSKQHARRRGHTKSRRGCYNCKRRRIKCPENKPTCSHCTKQGLTCEYPAVQIQQSSIALKTPSQKALRSSIPMQVQQQGAVFTMTDFRLFHYFIETAHPDQPPANDAVWKHDIPSMAHRHDFLLHSMLALSASEIACREPESADLSVTAMTHRVKAIKSFNQALTRGMADMEEGNAMLAACYALLFQSVLMADGIIEYMAFLRGCVLVANQMCKKKHKLIFHVLLGEDMRTAMEPHLGSDAKIDSGDIDDAVASLDAMAHLCERPSEKAWRLLLFGLAKTLFMPPREALMLNHKIYNAFSYYVGNDEFQHVIDPKNTVGQILQSHIVALQFVMQPHVKYDRMGPEANSGFGPVRWLEGVHRNIPESMFKYVEWPTSIYARRIDKSSLQAILTGKRFLELEPGIKA